MPGLLITIVLFRAPERQPVKDQIFNFKHIASKLQISSETKSFKKHIKQFISQKSLGGSSETEPIYWVTWPARIPELPIYTKIQPQLPGSYFQSI